MPDNRWGIKEFLVHIRKVYRCLPNLQPVCCGTCWLFWCMHLSRQCFTIFLLQLHNDIWQACLRDLLYVCKVILGSLDKNRAFGSKGGQTPFCLWQALQHLKNCIPQFFLSCESLHYHKRVMDSLCYWDILEIRLNSGEDSMHSIYTNNIWRWCWMRVGKTHIVGLQSEWLSILFVTTMRYWTFFPHVNILNWKRNEKKGAWPLGTWKMWRYNQQGSKVPGDAAASVPLPPRLAHLHDCINRLETEGFSRLAVGNFLSCIHLTAGNVILQFTFYYSSCRV